MPRRLALAALALLSAATVFAAGATVPASASGRFEDKRFKLEIAGAYAYWGKTGGFGDDPVIRVAVSNAGFQAAALDAFFDKAGAIHDRFADDDVKVVNFEFDPNGKYTGLSYYFESGDGCGFCYDSKVKSTVKAAGGRLAGTVSYKGDDREFDVTFDVPMPPKTWGDPLPKDGGAPGKAWLAYHAALEARDKKAIYALLDADMKAMWAKDEKDGDLDGYVEFLWHDQHTMLKTIQMGGGFVNGDRAVVLFTGSNAFIDHLYGEALLRRENGAWLVHTDMVDVGER
jgi:hypothetical protein